MVKKWVFILMMISGQIFASTKFGGNGLIHVHSARVIPKGHLQFYSGVQYFGKVANFGGSNDAYTLWNVQGFGSFNLGINPHFELAVSPIIYQDTNSNGGNAMDGQANLPDDLFVTMKIASFTGLESPYYFGGLLSARIPAASQHNLLYEPYSAGSVEVGVTGLFSYFSNTTFPEEGWALHGNLGYWNHNDVGKELTGNDNDPKPNAMSSELLLGVGFLYPAGTFDFSAEISTRYFLTKPPVTAYSREFVSYITAGVYYKPYQWVTIQMGLDLKLFTEEDQSDYTTTSLPLPPPEFPNYPSWRMMLGVRLAVLPTSMYASPEKSQLRKKATDRQEILEQMMKGQRDTENAEDEISRIRAERARVEEELQRLRKLLEEEKKKGDNK